MGADIRRTFMRLALPLMFAVALNSHSPGAQPQNKQSKADAEALAKSAKEEAAALKAVEAKAEASAGKASDTAPYPPSPVITDIIWSSTDSAVRQAPGSDIWPVTWGDDDALYTAYGDGWGFAPPRSSQKLSLGVARVAGMPPNVRGANIPAPTVERLGDGPKGPKPSGILMVNGVLYLWTRNLGAQLAWSSDHARKWTWADWKFEESFACPSFCNFGRNYEGARDNYVYIYSSNNDTAYASTDTMVLARAPKDRLRERAAYEFFVKIDGDGQPVWSRDIKARGAVFTDKARCYRSAVNYCAPLKRYLWVQAFKRDRKSKAFGGLAIYDAPEPWGPWTTAYFARHWDMVPGTGNIPAKWASPDGKKMWMVFSGDDHFVAREFTVKLRKK